MLRNHGNKRKLINELESNSFATNDLDGSSSLNSDLALFDNEPLDSTTPPIGMFWTDLRMIIKDARNKLL